eukprot:1139482-Pelagomonas_calceolata.AAC.1
MMVQVPGARSWTWLALSFLFFSSWSFVWWRGPFFPSLFFPYRELGLKLASAETAGLKQAVFQFQLPFNLCTNREVGLRLATAETVGPQQTAFQFQLPFNLCTNREIGLRLATAETVGPQQTAEANLRAKDAERQMETANSKLAGLQQDVAQQQALLGSQNLLDLAQQQSHCRQLEARSCTAASPLQAAGSKPSGKSQGIHAIPGGTDSSHKGAHSAACADHRAQRQGRAVRNQAAP